MALNRTGLLLAKRLKSLAGAGGFEPPDGGIKIRCLTTWLRPNAPQGWWDPAESGPDNSPGSPASQRLSNGFTGARRGQTGLRKCRQIGVGSADQNADPLVALGPVDAACDGGEGCCAAGLGDDRMIRPEPALGLGDRHVLDQDDAAHEFPGDLEIEFADPLCAERIGGKRFDGHVDRLVRLQRGVKRARTFRLDADDLDPALKPGGYAGNEPAAANRNENRIERLEPESVEVLLPFQGTVALEWEEDLDRTIRMDRERSALRHIRVTPLLGLGIRRASDHRLCSIGLYLCDLGGRCDFRHEHVRLDPELLGGVGDGGAVIAARRGGAAGLSRWSGQEIVEGAARLERTGRL